MDHTIALIQKSHEGDEEAKAQIVEENTGLIWCIVKRFRGRGAEVEDLFQIGSIGLLKAIDKFDLSYDVKFSTYAVPMISGEIKRFLRDDGMIKVSRSLKETAGRANACREKLRERTGREPTVEEVAREAGVETEELVLAMEAGAEVVMVGHIALPAVTGEDTPACLSREIATGLLREQLGFEGLAVTDSLSMQAITGGDRRAGSPGRNGSAADARGPGGSRGGNSGRGGVRPAQPGAN